MYGNNCIQYGWHPTTITLYHEALMAKPASPQKSSANPKVLNNLDKRARQILIGYSSDKENATLGTSLLDLKDNANRVVTKMDNPTQQKGKGGKQPPRPLNSKSTLDQADWQKVHRTNSSSCGTITNKSRHCQLHHKGRPKHLRGKNKSQ